MKKIAIKSLTTFAVIILIAKISNWFLNFSEATNSLINTLMFSVIGVSYLIFAFYLDNKLSKMVLLFSGIYLLIWSFLPEKNILTFIGILAILIPILISRFSKESIHN